MDNKDLIIDQALTGKKYPLELQKLLLVLEYTLGIEILGK